MLTSNFSSGTPLSFSALLVKEKNTSRIHSCTSVSISSNAEWEDEFWTWHKGKRLCLSIYLLTQILLKPLRLPGKDLFLWRWAMLILNWTCLYYFLQNCVSFLRGINFFFMTTTMQSNFKCPEERTRKDEWKGIEWFIRLWRRSDEEFYNSGLLI